METQATTYDYSLPVGSFALVEIQAVLEKVARDGSVGLDVDKELWAWQLLPAKAERMNRTAGSGSRRPARVQCRTQAATRTGICMLTLVGAGDWLLGEPVPDAEREVGVHRRVPALVAKERRAVAVAEARISALLNLATTRHLR